MQRNSITLSSFSLHFYCIIVDLSICWLTVSDVRYEDGQTSHSITSNWSHVYRFCTADVIGSIVIWIVCNCIFGLPLSISYLYQEKLNQNRRLWFCCCCFCLSIGLFLSICRFKNLAHTITAIYFDWISCLTIVSLNLQFENTQSIRLFDMVWFG